MSWSKLLTPGLTLLGMVLHLCLGSQWNVALAEPPVLRAALENEPLTLDWNASRTPADRFIVSLIMRGLLKYESGSKPICDLCRTYRVSEDGLTYSFELGDDSEWSDGAKVEAQQFVDSFQRLLNPALGLATGEEYGVIAGSPQKGAKTWDPKRLEVTVAGKNRLSIRLSEASTLFPHLLTKVSAFPIRREFTKNASQDFGVKMASGPVLGPYQLAAWEKGHRLVLEGNPKFLGKRPVYRVDFRIGAHPELLANFKAGRLDLLPSPTTEDLLSLPGKNVQVSPYWATRNLVINVRQKYLSNSHLRHAILSSLDRSQLPGVLKNGERSATGLIPPGMTGYRELPLSTFDLVRAKSERAQVGRVRVELKLLIHQGTVQNSLAKWLTAELEKIQVTLQIHAASERDYQETFESGNFDLALQVWGFDIASPLDLLRAFRTDSPINHGHWTSVAYDALYTQLLSQASESHPFTSGLSVSPAMDPARLVDEITRLIEIQEVAVIPLGYPMQSMLLGPRVSSFAMTPYGDPDLVRIKLRSGKSESLKTAKPSQR